MANEVKLKEQEDSKEPVQSSDAAFQDIAPPEAGWQHKNNKESEMHWYARVQAHLDGPKRQKQKAYLDIWRDMPPGVRETFRQRMQSMATGGRLEIPSGAATFLQKHDASDCGVPPAGAPVTEFDEKGTLDLPKGYSVKMLLADYKDVSSDKSMFMKQDQQRWEMYGRLALLIRHGDVKSVTACGDKSPFVF